MIMNIPESSMNWEQTFFDINNIIQRIMTGTQPLEEVWEEIIQEYKNNGLMEVIDKVNEVHKEKSPKE